jgi:hypothetical protein
LTVNVVGNGQRHLSIHKPYFTTSLKANPIGVPNFSPTD